MSRSIKIRKPKWIDPKDKQYLSLFGTILHGFKLEETVLPVKTFHLKRRHSPGRLAMTAPTPKMLPAPIQSAVVSDAQTETLKVIATAANQAGFEPKPLPSHPEMLTVEMFKVSDGKVPVYARR